MSALDLRVLPNLLKELLDLGVAVKIDTHKARP